MPRGTQPGPEHGGPHAAEVLTLHAVSLTFKDPHKEQLYRLHEQRHWLTSDLFVLLLHFLSGSVHASLNARILTGNSLSPLTARLVLPFACICLCHLLIVQHSFYQKHRTVFLLAFEVAYALVICLPFSVRNQLWSLAELRSFKGILKQIFFSSGSMLCCWSSFMLQKPWLVYIWAVPLRQWLNSLFFNPNICRTLHSTPSGQQAAQDLFWGIEAVASSLVPSAQAQYSCAAILRFQGTLVCCLLLYVRYQLEVRARVAFAKSLQCTVRRHPFWEVPVLIRLVVQPFLCLAAFSIAWSMVNSTVTS